MAAPDLALHALAVQAAFHEARLAQAPDPEPNRVGEQSAEAERKRISECLEAAFDGLVAALAPPLVLEVGAHAADFARRCRAALPGSRIVAFEAHPRVHARFAAAAATAGIEYHNRAVAAEAGTLTFNVPVNPKRQVEKATMGSLLVGTFGAQHASYEVEAVSLDAWLGADAGKPSVMWVDVEGAIGMVLDGGPRAFDACLALYVEVEATARWPGQLLDRDVYARLARHGLVPVLRDVQRKAWQYNVLLVRESLLGDPRIAALHRDFFGRVFAPRPPAPAAAPPAAG